MAEARFQIGPLNKAWTFRLVVQDGRAMVIAPDGALVESLPIGSDATRVLQMPGRPAHRAAEPLRAVPAPVSPAPAPAVLEAIVDPTTGRISVPGTRQEAHARAVACSGLVVQLPIMADYRQQGRAGWNLGNRQQDPRMAGAWNHER